MLIKHDHLFSIGDYVRDRRRLRLQIVKMGLDPDKIQIHAFRAIPNLSVGVWRLEPCVGEDNASPCVYAIHQDMEWEAGYAYAREYLDEQPVFQVWFENEMSKEEVLRHLLLDVLGEWVLNLHATFPDVKRGDFLEFLVRHPVQASKVLERENIYVFWFDFGQTGELVCDSYRPHTIAIRAETPQDALDAFFKIRNRIQAVWGE